MDAAMDTDGAALTPFAYTPCRDTRDYVLGWTDATWIDRGPGRMTENCGE